MQHLDDLGSLGSQGPAASGIHQAVRTREKPHRVSRRRRVQQQQIRFARPLELFHLAEYEDLADARDGRRDDVENPRGDEPLGDPAEAVVHEVLEEGVVRRDHTAVHRAGSAGVQQHFVVAEGDLGAEEHGKGAGVVEADDEDLEARIGGHAGKRRRHRRLPDATFAGHDEDPALAAELCPVHRRGHYRRSPEVHLLFPEMLPG